MDQGSKAPTLVASTSDTYCCSVAESKVREGQLRDILSLDETAIPPANTLEDDLEVNYFKCAQWY